MTAVDTAQAKGWRHVYFNSMTLGFLGVHALALAGIVMLGWSWWGFLLAIALYVPRLFFVIAA